MGLIDPPHFCACRSCQLLWITMSFLGFLNWLLLSLCLLFLKNPSGLGVYSCNAVRPRHSTTEVLSSACIVWAPLACGCSVFVLSREVTGLLVFSLVKLRLVVGSLRPLRYGGRSVLGPNRVPIPSVDGVNICVYQLVVNEKDRGVEVHRSPTQVGAPLLSRLWVLYKVWAKESDSLQTCLLSPPWFHVTWRSCTDWFFPASFPAVVLVPPVRLLWAQV